MMTERKKTAIFLGLLAALFVGGIFAAWQFPMGRELVKGLVRFAGMFFTPFVLEATIAVVGGVALFLFLRHKREEEGDGWVEMEVSEEDDEENP